MDTHSDERSCYNQNPYTHDQYHSSSPTQLTSDPGSESTSEHTSSVASDTPLGALMGLGSTTSSGHSSPTSESGSESSCTGVVGGAALAGTHRVHTAFALPLWQRVVHMGGRWSWWSGRDWRRGEWQDAPRRLPQAIAAPWRAKVQVGTGLPLPPRWKTLLWRQRAI